MSSVALGRARGAAIALVVPVTAIAVWWFASAGSTSPFYPSLSDILDTFRETWLFARFGSDIVPSLERMLIGYLLAIVVGAGVGLLLGHMRALDHALQPLVQFGRAIPATALVPVGITLLGIGNAPKIYLIAFVSMFPILLNTIDGVRGVEPGLIDVARSYRLTRRQRVLQLELPAASPQIFAGMRIALGIAFIMMIVTEMVAATSGIGYLTLQAQQTFASTQMWAGMILLALLGAGLNLIFVAVERRVLSWHYGATGRS